MDLKFFTSIVGYFFLLVSCSHLVQAQDKNNSNPTRFHLSGRILNPEHEALTYASIALLPLDLTLSSDSEGVFSVAVPRGKYTVVIHAMGYVEHRQIVDLFKQEHLEIVLVRQSIALEEFVIMAQYKKESSDKALISQTALSYIQPTSIVDALVLLPGGLYSEPSLNQFSKINFRQSGSDNNSSLGVSIISDGVSMHNDGSRNQLYGITAGSNPSFGKERNLVFNAGLDMRMLSTDHVESLSITRGISSAKSGNLSSGQIELTAKQGVSPLEVRTKLDPNIQLGYVGKGFQLARKMGVLHLGMDILSSTPDVREKLTRFTRMTAQANHHIDGVLFERAFTVNTKWNYTQTIDNFKTDRATEANDETYKVHFNKWDFTIKSSFFVEQLLMDKLELISHLDYTYDALDRRLLVYSDGGVSMSNAVEEGPHRAQFLPSKYHTSYQIENKPLQLFFQLNANKYFNLSEVLAQRIAYGVEYNSSKNYGMGAVVNPDLPPFPHDNTFIRPRANKDIPALIHTAYYLENQLQMQLKSLNTNLNLTTGLRVSQLLNLPTSYSLNNKLLAEPRLQLTAQTDYLWGNRVLTSNFRLGFGQQNKLPTLDYLYPDKIYRDFEVFNWYPNREEERLLWTHTSIHNAENKKIEVNRNQKFEWGVDLGLFDFDLSITGFEERSNSGFEYFYSYIPISYVKYTTPKFPVQGIPDLNHFNTQDVQQFAMLPTVINSSKVIKKGLEYRINTPKIKAINTQIEINGAYYKTTYSNNQPKMYYPKNLIDNESYPYVGLYDQSRIHTSSRFNTNIWINTHIPKLKLVLTTFIQAVWFTTSERGQGESFIPSAYLDKNGVTHALDWSAPSRDPLFNALDLTSEKINFNQDKTAPSYTVNFKGTKEFKKFGKLSFFINNIIGIQSKYQDAFQVNQKSWSAPYFGVELTFKLE